MNAETRTHANTAPTTAAAPVRSGLTIQRKCSCGGSAGLTGKCDDCEKKKLAAGALQKKLTVNEPGDVYEQEADRVAEGVMRMPAPVGAVSQSSAPFISRAATGGGGGAEAPGIVHDVLRSSGQPLDASTRAFMEPRFGHDFSGVRVHTDARAAESARAVNALAYTVGSNVVFGEGQYAPGSGSGQRLLAHELTHVVQQGGVLDNRLQKWGMDNAPIGDPKRDVDLQREMASASSTPMPSIKLKRNRIHLTENDYGHWWAEIGGKESYGWWPKYQVGLKETLFGTVGELNGVTTFNGTATMDPHHGQQGEKELDVACTDASKSEATVVSEMRSFARGYNGEWRWTLGWGQNCHTFQKRMLANSKLKTM